MPESVIETSERALRNLPYPARPVLDPDDVQVPEGYTVEPVVAGLNFPNSIAFGDDGTIFIVEGGSGVPHRPVLAARVHALTPDGDLRTVVRETEAPIMGLDAQDGALYAGLNTTPTRIVRYDLPDDGTPDDVERTTLVDDLPGLGLHPVNGPRFGPDGNLYFGQGTVTNTGINGPSGFLTGELPVHPKVHDVPGQDITLAGHNYGSPDPRKPFPKPVKTGAFKPFGTKSKKGERIEGRTKCTSSVLRCSPDGSDVELLAWGLREAYGYAWDERNRLHVSVNDMDAHGLRPVKGGGEAVVRVKNADRPLGEVTEPTWHGWPDIRLDGTPVDDPKAKPHGKPQPKRLIEDPPRYAGKADVLLAPHQGAAKADVDRTSSFGHRGDLFLCLAGTFAPNTSKDPDMLNHGFRVARIDLASGDATTFLANTRPGPATPAGKRTQEPSGGIERPVDCKFGPDGNLYVVDVGRMDSTKEGNVTWGRTGVLWRVVPDDQPTT